MSDSQPVESGVVFEDADYRLAVVDLLGVIAYGELSAFERLVDDAKLAPSLRGKGGMCAMASSEFRHVSRLPERLGPVGGGPFAGRGPFRAGVDPFPSP